MSENIDAGENGNLQRFYRAMAILRQKIDTLLKGTPNLLEINSLEEIPADKREDVENQLWRIFVYGEYFVENLVSWQKKMADDLSDQAILFTTAKEHFDYYSGKYKSFIKKTKGLIDVSKAPSRKEVEITKIISTLYSKQKNSGKPL